MKIKRIELSNVQFRLLYQIAKGEMTYIEKNDNVSYFLHLNGKTTKIGKSTVISLLSKQAIEMIPSSDSDKTGKIIITEKGKRAFNLHTSIYQIYGDVDFKME